MYAADVRDRIRMPPFVGVVDPEHTEPLGPAAGEQTAPMTVAVYMSNGRYVEPTRRET